MAMRIDLTSQGQFGQIFSRFRFFFIASPAHLAIIAALRGGYKLEDGTGRQMVGRTVTDGPFPETKEVVGGVFVIAAANYDDAVALASTCPHLDFGRIELRRVDPV